MSLKKHIPNTITSINLLCGLLGVIFTLRGRIDVAFPLMLGACVFDFCDGLAARLLDAHSPIGGELDSLADMVSFGVLPSLMLYALMKASGWEWICFIPLILAVFSAVRLAKFNLDPRQKDGFIGLATPSAALICASLCYFVAANPGGRLATLCSGAWFIPVLSIVLSALLVSEIPMFSMKFGGGKKSDTRTGMMRTAFLSIVAIIAIVVAVLGANWSMIVLASFTVYILMNIFFALFPLK